jgi:hypothetical protein
LDKSSIVLKKPWQIINERSNAITIAYEGYFIEEKYIQKPARN